MTLRSGLVEAFAVVSSLAVHGGLALAFGDPPAREPAPVFVAAKVIPPRPPLPPEPVVEAAPPPPPKPEPKKAAEIAAPPAPASPETVAPRRVVQGLSASSFAPGSGVAVRAGNTLSVAAEGPGAALDAIPSFAAAVERPKCRRPPLSIPDSVRRDRVEGLVGILFDVGADGRVSNVRVTDSLTPDADAACVSAWSGTHCKPGTDGTVAVPVADMPFTCRFEAITP
jgi:periplasmic protein TonB